MAAEPPSPVHQTSRRPVEVETKKSRMQKQAARRPVEVKMKKLAIQPQAPAQGFQKRVRVDPGPPPPRSPSSPRAKLSKFAPHKSTFTPMKVEAKR